MQSLRDQKIRYIVDQQYHQYLVTKDGYEGFVFKNSLSAEEKKQKLEQMAQDREELAKQTPEEIQRLYDAAMTDEQQRIDEKEQRLAHETTMYFNQPRLRLRHEHWAAMATWTLEEAQALALGIDPEQMERSDMPFEIKLHVAKNLRDIREAVERASYAHDIYPPVPPLEFLKWARRKRLPFPEKLAHLIEAEHKPSAPKSAPPEKPLSTRERENLLRLIIGMAIKGYSFNPTSAKNSAIKDIMDDLAQLGISLSEDTIRQKLKEAAELLPQTVDSP